MSSHPLQQRSSVDAIYPDATQLLACTSALAIAVQLPQHQSGTSRIGERSSSDYSSHYQAQRVYHQVSLSAFDTFVAVVPTYSASLSGLDRLAVQAPG